MHCGLFMPWLDTDKRAYEQEKMPLYDITFNSIYFANMNEEWMNYSEVTLKA